MAVHGPPELRAAGGAGASAAETAPALIAQVHAACAGIGATIARAEGKAEVTARTLHVRRHPIASTEYTVTEVVKTVTGAAVRAAWRPSPPLALAPIRVPFRGDIGVVATTLAEVKALCVELDKVAGDFAFLDDTAPTRGELRKIVGNLAAIGAALVSLEDELRGSPSAKAELEARLAEAAAIARAAIADYGAAIGDPAPAIHPALSSMGLMESHVSKLSEWVGTATGTPAAREWTLAYQASRDGWASADFHRCCDGKARLLVLVRVADGGWLCGGFTGAGFEAVTSGKRTTDPSVFLFTLTNPHGIEPTMLRPTKSGDTLCHCPPSSYGPYWGSSWSEFGIDGNANMAGKGVWNDIGRDGSVYPSVAGKGGSLFWGSTGRKTLSDYVAFTL